MASVPFNSRGFGFRLLGIPIEVSWWFFFVAAILGMRGGDLGAMKSLAVWIGVVFVGILAHEMGHAVAVRAFGSHPSIMIQGLFNVTVWQPGPSTTPFKRMLISLAGPAAGIAIGSVLFGIGIARGFDTGRLVFAIVGGGDSSRVLDQIVLDGLFVNLGWSILNLFPIMPLDGGKVVASLLDMVAPGRGTVWALRFSVVAGAILCVGALYLGRGYTFLAILLGWTTVSAFFALSRGAGGGAGAGALVGGGARTANGPEAQLVAALREAATALESRDFTRAADRAEMVREKSQSPALLGQAVQILASIAVLKEDWPRADALLSTMPAGQPIDVALRGLVALRRGRHEEAFTSLTAALEREPGENVALAVTEAAVRTGRAARIAEILGAPRVRRTLSPMALRRVADELAVAGERDGADQLRRYADAGSLS